MTSDIVRSTLTEQIDGLFDSSQLQNHHIPAESLSPQNSDPNVVTTPQPPSIVGGKMPAWSPAWEDVKDGLTDEEVHARIEIYGINKIVEKRDSLIVLLCRNLIGLMPILVWIAILIKVIELFLGIAGYVELALLCSLQTVNFCIKGYITYKARVMSDSLKAKHIVEISVIRCGKHVLIDSTLIVPGDIIQLSIGMIVPADCRLGHCNLLTFDQSSLTGESLPVKGYPGRLAFGGSIVKTGTGEAVVVATGQYSVIGESQTLIGSVNRNTRYQQVETQVMQFIFMFLVIGLSCILSGLLIRGAPYIITIDILVTTLIAGMPVAMQVVCASIMGLCSTKLSAKGVIVSSIASTEELCGMSILCTDKTGTLTNNKLEIINSLCTPFYGLTLDQLLLYSAIAVEARTNSQDAIDTVITNYAMSIGEEKAKRAFETEFGLDIGSYSTLYEYARALPVESFVPFDPDTKICTATVMIDQNQLTVVKGAALNVIAYCDPEESEDATYDELIWYQKVCAKTLEIVNNLAQTGYRSLVVGCVVKGKPRLLGVLAIADSARHDTADVIREAQDMKIKVLMISGDGVPICRELGVNIGTGNRILHSSAITAYEEGKLPPNLMEAFPYILARSDGVAEVLPQQKHKIVTILQGIGHIVGMTGDGVNDAPALRQANVGIAVGGATDAARTSSSMFLLEEGLGAVTIAIKESKMCNAKIQSYIEYRISATVRIILFFFLVCVVFTPGNWSYLSFQNIESVLNEDIKKNIDVITQISYMAPDITEFDKNAILPVENFSLAVSEAMCYHIATLHKSNKLKPDLESVDLKKIVDHNEATQTNQSVTTKDPKVSQNDQIYNQFIDETNNKAFKEKPLANGKSPDPYHMPKGQHVVFVASLENMFYWRSNIFFPSFNTSETFEAQEAYLQGYLDEANTEVRYNCINAVIKNPPKYPLDLFETVYHSIKYPTEKLDLHSYETAMVIYSYILKHYMLSLKNNIQSHVADYFSTTKFSNADNPNKISV